MLEFNFLIFFISLLFLISATIYDVKKRMVPNFLIFYFLLIAVSLKIFESFFLKSFSIFLNAFFSFLITLVITYILWEIGVFAGGDLKVFLVVSILNPFNLNFLNFLNIFGIISKPLFSSLTLLITSILVSAPLLILYALFLFFLKGYYYLLFSRLKKIDLISILSSVFVLFLISSFMQLFAFTIPFLLHLLFFIIFLYVFRNLEKTSFYFSFGFIAVLYILLFAYALWFRVKVFNLQSLVYIVFSLILFYVLITSYKIITTKILKQKKYIFSLKPGDVLVNNYYKVGNKILEKKISFLDFLKQTFSNKYHENLIVDSRKAGGLSEQDITFLNTSYKHNLKKEVLLKKTLPFTPFVLVAYILLNFLGDWIWFIF